MTKTRARDQEEGIRYVLLALSIPTDCTPSLPPLCSPDIVCTDYVNEIPLKEYAPFCLLCTLPACSIQVNNILNSLIEAFVTTLKILSIEDNKRTVTIDMIITHVT